MTPLLAAARAQSGGASSLVRSLTSLIWKEKRRRRRFADRASLSFNDADQACGLLIHHERRSLGIGALWELVKNYADERPPPSQRAVERKVRTSNKT